MVALAENVSTTMLAVLTTWHVVVILVAILILFGGKKLPELARGLGRGLRIFKEEVSGVKDSVSQAIEEEPRPAAPKAPDPQAPTKTDKPAEGEPADGKPPGPDHT